MDSYQNQHTAEIEDIILKVPSWILRWGITLSFIIFLSIILLSCLVKYPDIVKSRLIITSSNSAKSIVAKMPGKLMSILVVENQKVNIGQDLAYLESTANHSEVSTLLNNLKVLETHILQKTTVNISIVKSADSSRFGELQPSYQIFVQEYLNFMATINNGSSVNKRRLLDRDLTSITKEIDQLNQEKTIQLRNFEIANEDYEMHKKLALGKVETSAELRQQEAKFLSQKSMLIKTESAIIVAKNDYSAKQKEILELTNQINQERDRFFQSLSSLISQVEDWKSKYILTASQNGKVTFAGVIQKNQVLSLNQTVFFINSSNDSFFGQMLIPQNNMGKVKEGQKVIIKLKSYPFEEYGILTGQIESISEATYQDSAFHSIVSLNLIEKNKSKRSIQLKQGMVADAEIITKNASMLQRIVRNILKLSDTR